jgi:putative ABC transport system substrate-binding protein
MRRREFITLIGGAATWPIAASAQQADQVRRVGVLSNIAESDLEAQSTVAALHQELRKLGWVNGRNLQVDHRWAAGNPERATAFAKELVALKPDVIVAHTTPSVVAMQKHTNRVCADFRPDRHRVYYEPGASGCKHYRLHQFRIFDGWQMGGIA